MAMGEVWTGLGSMVAGFMFLWAMFQQYFPHQLRGPLEKYGHQLKSLVYPYIQITFHEYGGERFKRSDVFTAIDSYLTVNSSKSAKRLRADMGENAKSLILCMDDHEEVADEFDGVKLWWSSKKTIPKPQPFSYFSAPEEKRFYKLTFHKRHRDLITGRYLNHVLEQGKAVRMRNRQRKLYTNNKKAVWSHVVFDHPATFETLAMDPQKKKEIVDDLITFSKAKDHYSMIGKAWKRGYLLYGPPGTGKSSMVAAMANLLDYDVYDLELTAVNDNTDLRKLLIETSSKSIIVIEDIDCSLELSGRRNKKKEERGDEEKPEQFKEKESKVTLSGLLNSIDGLWSACVGERLIVFTTNHVDELDPALIRRGRMDKHIELSYCCFEAFKILAKNYLDIDAHELFERIGRLMEEILITPADVAEYLMPKTPNKRDVDACLENLLRALEAKKEAARLKANEEVKEIADALAGEEGKGKVETLTPKEGLKEDEPLINTEVKEAESSPH